MRFLRTLTFLAAAIATAGAAAAHEFHAGDLSLEHPWIAEPPPGAPTAAGFLVITNDGNAADRLIDVRCEFADRSEIHEMKVDDAGVMQMRQLADGLEIPAGQSVTLAKGGYHLMFMHVTERPVVGDMVPVTLVFEHAGEVDLMFSVQAHGDDAMDDHMEMDGSMDMESSQ